MAVYDFKRYQIQGKSEPWRDRRLILDNAWRAKLMKSTGTDAIRAANSLPFNDHIIVMHATQPMVQLSKLIRDVDPRFIIDIGFSIFNENVGKKQQMIMDILDEYNPTWKQEAYNSFKE